MRNLLRFANFRRATLRRLALGVSGGLREAAAWLALLGYLALTVGVPLPAQWVAAEGDYPCAGGSCGCATAEQCWSRCCCHTPAQRLAWARQRGLTPPRELLAAAEEVQQAAAGRSCCQAQTAADVSHVAPGRNCCSSKKAADRVAAADRPMACQSNPADPAATVRNCCAASPDASRSTPTVVDQADDAHLPDSDTNADSSSPAAPAGLVWLGGLRAMNCQGISPDWLTAGAVVVPSPSRAPLPVRPPLAWLRVASEFSETAAFPPPPPVPRPVA